jgi:hypothetical protein
MRPDAYLADLWTSGSSVLVKALLAKTMVVDLVGLVGLIESGAMHLTRVCVKGGEAGRSSWALYRNQDGALQRRVSRRFALSCPAPTAAIVLPMS